MSTRKFVVQDWNVFYKKIYPQCQGNLPLDLQRMSYELVKRVQEILGELGYSIDSNVELVSKRTMKGDIEANGTIRMSTRSLATFVTFIIAHEFVKNKSNRNILAKHEVVERTLIDIQEIIQLITFDRESKIDDDETRRLAYNLYIEQLFNGNSYLPTGNKILGSSVHALQDGLKLTVNYNWHFQYPEEPLIFEKSGDKNEVITDAGGNLTKYYIEIQKRYSLIKLNKEFSIPVTDIIQLPLSEVDPVRDEKIDLLEKEADTLQTKDPLSIHLGQLRNIIRSLRSEKSKQHKIVSLLEEGQNVFIHAQAGSGKSTILRWLMYSIASGEILRNSHIFPVFVELRGFEKNLEAHIIGHLRKHQQVLLKDERLHYIFLIDGFDEYKGNEHLLLQDIAKVAGVYSAQIVFTGRSVPSYENIDVPFTTFNIYPYSIKDIRNLTSRVLNKSIADRLVTTILNYDLKSYVERPLFFAYVLAFIDKRRSSFDFKKLPSIIKNKGQLLEKVIVNDFLGEYERDRTHGDKLLWDDKRNFQVRILAKIAFHMTFVLEDKEAILESELLGVLIQEIKTHETYTSATLIKDFLKHEFLDLLTDEGTRTTKYAFNKKELRYFFAALNVKHHVNSHEKFYSIRKKYIRNSYPSTRLTDKVWNHIEEYLLGILPLEYLLSVDAEKKRYGQYVYTDNLFDHLNLCSKLQEMGIISESFELLNRKNLLDFALMSLHGISNNPNDGKHLLVGLYGQLLNILQLFPRFMKSNWISYWNEFYLWNGYYEFIQKRTHFGQKVERGYKGELMFRIIFESRIPIYYKEYLSIISKGIPEAYISCISGEMDNVLKKLIVSKKEVYEIIEGYLFNEKVEKWRFRDIPFKTIGREFIDKYLVDQEELHEFVNYLVEHKKIKTNLNWVRVMKLLYSYRYVGGARSNVCGKREFIDTHKLSNKFIEILDKMFQASTLKTASNSQLFSIAQYLQIFDDTYKDKILDGIHKQIQDSESDQLLCSRLIHFANLCIRSTDFNYLKNILANAGEHERYSICFYAVQIYRYPHKSFHNFELLDCVSEAIEKRALNQQYCLSIINLMNHSSAEMNQTFRNAVISFYTHHPKNITISRDADILANHDFREAIPFLEKIISNNDGYSDPYVYYLLSGIDIHYFFQYKSQFTELHSLVLRDVKTLTSIYFEAKSKHAPPNIETKKTIEILTFAQYVGNEEVAYQVELMYGWSGYFRPSEKEILTDAYFALNSRAHSIEKFKKEER